MVSSRLLQTFLDDAWDDKSALDLRAQLRQYETDAAEAIKGGSIISTSANGRHVALAGASGNGAITQVEIVEAWRRLINMFDDCLSVLQSLGTITGDTSQDDTDQLVYNRMKQNLRPITGYTNNFLYLSK